MRVERVAACQWAGVAAGEEDSQGAVVVGHDENMGEHRLTYKRPLPSSSAPARSRRFLVPG